MSYKKLIGTLISNIFKTFNKNYNLLRGSENSVGERLINKSN